MSVIVYRNPDGGLCVVYPSPFCELSIEEIAAKDVPEGCMWQIAPDRPSRDHDWNGTDWIYAPPDPSIAIEAARAQMKCSRFQARAALLQAGLLSTVEAAIAQADPITQMAWTDAVEFRRNSPTISALAQSLSLSDQQLDDLFTSAMAIEA